MIDDSRFYRVRRNGRKLGTMTGIALRRIATEPHVSFAPVGS